MLNKIPCIITFLTLCVFINSCNDITQGEKFDQAIWVLYTEVDGPYRDLMAEDLLENHKLKGLSHKQMLHLLGGPTQDDSTGVYYQLKVEYDMIDPISEKDLHIKFNKDSIVKSAKIEEWHKH